MCTLTPGAWLRNRSVRCAALRCSGAQGLRGARVPVGYQGDVGPAPPCLPPQGPRSGLSLPRPPLTGAVPGFPRSMPRAAPRAPSSPAAQCVGTARGRGEGLCVAPGSVPVAQPRATRLPGAAAAPASCASLATGSARGSRARSALYCRFYLKANCGHLSGREGASCGFHVGFPDGEM